MSRLILRSIQHLPKAPLSLPLAISLGFRNVLAPRYGLYTVELDATVLLDFLLTVDTFRYVVKLDLYIPSASDLIQRKVLERIAGGCPYLEELSLLIVFIRRGQVLGFDHLWAIGSMHRLDSLRIVGASRPSFAVLEQIAPASLRTYSCGNSLVGTNAPGSQFIQLPRQLTSLDVSSPGTVDDTLDNLVNLPPKLRVLNMHACNLMPTKGSLAGAPGNNDGNGNDAFDFSLLPRDLRIAKLNRSCLNGIWIKNMHQLPEFLTFLDLSSCGLRGEITNQFRMLPPYLRSLSLKENNLTSGSGGEDGIDWMLPDLLVDIDISFNYLTGDINFATLPQYLETFRARRNQFEKNLSAGPPRNPDAKGLTSVADLPRSLKVLDLSHNPGIKTDPKSGSTTTILSELPPRLEILDLTSTSIAGFIDLRVMPMSVRNITMYEGNVNNQNPNSRLEERLMWYDVTLVEKEREDQQKDIRNNVSKRRVLHPRFDVEHCSGIKF